MDNTVVRKIDPDEIKHSKFAVDDVGRLFYWKGRLFRAILPEAVDAVKDMLNGGMIDELVSMGLFPKTWISDHVLEGYSLILEHEKVDRVTYPYEWSFSMLKNAAIALLETNRIARKYGYQTKDGHGFNVVFKYGYPKFVDLGSFVRNDQDHGAWNAYGEFLRFFYYPLKLWSQGDGFIARRMLHGDSFMPHASFLLYRNPILRPFGYTLISSISDMYHQFRNISSVESSKIIERVPLGLGGLIVFLRDKKLLPLQKVNFSSLIKKIKRITCKGYSTLWSGYHDRFYDEEGAGSTARFDRVIETIKDLNTRSVLEVAGNQGAFSMLLSERLNLDSIICSDNDEAAVDKMYVRIRDEKYKIVPAVLDFISPTLTTYTISSKERFRSDLVVAMAVTHHLVLTNKVSLECIFDTIKSYSNEYALVEFMPLGLFNGKGEVAVPEWYNVDWFRDHFRKYFDVLAEEQLENNRIMFLGKIIK